MKYFRVLFLWYQSRIQSFSQLIFLCAFLHTEKLLTYFKREDIASKKQLEVFYDDTSKHSNNSGSIFYERSLSDLDSPLPKELTESKEKPDQVTG